MLALKVVLDFACCICGHDMGVTLKCEGQGLKKGLNTPAYIKIACPTCGHHNVIHFTPGGDLLGVMPDRKRPRIPEPSLN